MHISTGWLDGFAILVAVLFVALVTSINDYSKERQFQALNRAGEAHPGTRYALASALSNASVQQCRWCVRGGMRRSMSVRWWWAT